jgi:arabinofuranosyltransferase
VFPDVAIIDTLGLNDHVIARNQDLRTTRGAHVKGSRQMAHDRQAPPGYVQCFRPNFRVRLGVGVIPGQRTQALTKHDIVACEDRFWR